MIATQEEIDLGEACTKCLQFFILGNGRPSLCTPCFDSMTEEERKDIPESFEPLLNDF